MAKKSSSKMSSDVVSSDSRKRMPSSGSREHAECVLISDESDAEQEYQPERPRAKRSKPIIVRQPEEQADSRSSTEPESGSDHDKSKRTGTPTPEPSEDEREEVTVVSCLKESLPGETRSEATPSPSERTDDSSVSICWSSLVSWLLTWSVTPSFARMNHPPVRSPWRAIRPESFQSYYNAERRQILQSRRLPWLLLRSKRQHQRIQARHWDSPMRPMANVSLRLS